MITKFLIVFLTFSSESVLSKSIYNDDGRNIVVEGRNEDGSLLFIDSTSGESWKCTWSRLNRATYNALESKLMSTVRTEFPQNLYDKSKVQSTMASLVGYTYQNMFNSNSDNLLVCNDSKSISLSGSGKTAEFLNDFGIVLSGSDIFTGHGTDYESELRLLEQKIETEMEHLEAKMEQLESELEADLEEFETEVEKAMNDLESVTIMPDFVEKVITELETLAEILETTVERELEKLESSCESLKDDLSSKYEELEMKVDNENINSDLKSEIETFSSAAAKQINSMSVEIDSTKQRIAERIETHNKELEEKLKYHLKASFMDMVTGGFKSIGSAIKDAMGNLFG